MGRLKTVGSRVASVEQRRVSAPLTTKDRRMTGRALQARRLRLWSRSPCCAECGRLTNYPSGFELDHITPLHQGGEDTDENCQILCVLHKDGEDVGCHAQKTKREAPRA